MSIKRPFSIIGVGKYLPKTVVNSTEIDTKLNLSKGTIYGNTGVKKRYKAIGESNTFMAKRALSEALQDANISISNIDCLIAASATFDYIIPNRSTLIKNAFKDADKFDFPCLDINSVCTSFITALDYASLLLSAKEYKNIAIVSSESSINGLNPNNIHSYGLFGDGAAAVIVSKINSDSGLIKYQSKTYSKGVKYTIIEGGGNVNHIKNIPYDSALHSFKMDGRKLLKNVKVNLPKFQSSFFSSLTKPFENVDLIVPHQASKLGLKLLESVNNGSSKNIVNQFENHGNCIAASIPIALVTSIKNNTLKQGQICYLIGTAAGITISGLLFKYSKK